LYYEKLRLHVLSIESAITRLRRNNNKIGIAARRIQQASNGYTWNITETLYRYLEMSLEDIEPVVKEIAELKAKYFKALINKSENKDHQMYYIKYYFNDFVDNLLRTAGEHKTQAYSDFEFLGKDANYMGQQNNDNKVILSGQVSDFFLGNTAEYPSGAFSIMVDAMKKVFKPTVEKNQKKISFDKIEIEPDERFTDLSARLDKDFYLDSTGKLKPKDHLNKKNKRKA
jgi:hypothetical protein